MLAHASHHDQRDVKQKEGGVGLGVCLMNELASRSALYAQKVRESETCPIYDSCPETNQDNIHRHIRPLAKVSSSPTLRLCSNRETISAVKPGIWRKFARGSPSSDRRRWGLGPGCSDNGLTPITTFMTVCPLVPFTLFPSSYC